jgi:hypothetical protein
VSKKTRTSAHARRNDDLRLLERHAGQDRAVKTLHRRLSACTEAEPCGSGACPICAEEPKRALKQVMKGVDPSTVSFVTIVATDRVALGELNTFDVANARRRLRDLFRCIPFGWGVFVLDMSMNEHREGLHGPFWAPHWHGLVIGTDPQTLSKILRSRLKSDSTTRRPLKVMAWDGNVKLLDYITRSEFSRRITT